MESIKYEEFSQSCGKAQLVLVAIFIYCIYSYFKYGYDTLNALTFVASIVCVLGVRGVSLIGEKAISDKNYRINYWDSALHGQVIMLLLGVLSIYVFAYKGVYSLYKSFGNLSILSTVYHIGIIIAAYQLVSATSKIQGVMKAIRTNDITRD
jgi:hypothetical protein